MSLAAFLGLLGAWVLAITMPGPDTVQLIRLGARSRRSAVFAALGICTGNVLWPVVTMLGLAALIATFPWILTVLYLFGGCFLIYMGPRRVPLRVRRLARPGGLARCFY